MSEPDFDVIVVGAGLAGLLTAAALGRATTRSRILVLGHNDTRCDPRVTAIMSGAVDCLRRAGLWDDKVLAPEPMLALKLIDLTQRLMPSASLEFRAQEAKQENLASLVENSKLRQFLLRLIGENERIELVFENLVSIDSKSSPNIPRLKLTNGRTVSCSLIVGADGGSSCVRDLCDIPMASLGNSVPALAATAVTDDVTRGVSYEFHTDTGCITLVPLSDSRVSITILTSEFDAQRLCSRPIDEALSEISVQSQYLLGDLSVGHDTSKDFAAFSPRSQLAQSFVSERVLLLGEAAHMALPIGAQGFNLTVFDVLQLVELISKTGASEHLDGAALETYDRARRREARLVVGAIAKFFSMNISSRMDHNLLRKFGFWGLSTSSLLRNAAVHLGSRR